VINKMTPQQKAALNLDRNIAVSAGAGSGKTWVLVQRYLTILENDKTILPRNIVAITFTRKAATEMRERIRENIHERLQDKNLDSRQHKRFAIILDELSQAPINTIHGFAANVLREFAISAGLDPGFKVLEDDQLSSPAILAVNRVVRNAEKNEPTAFKKALQFFDFDKLQSLIISLLSNFDSFKQIQYQLDNPVAAEQILQNGIAGFEADKWLKSISDLPDNETKTSRKVWKNLSDGLDVLNRYENYESVLKALVQINETLFTKQSKPRSTKSMRSLGPVVEELQQELDYLPELLQISVDGERYALAALSAIVPLVRSANAELDTIRQQTASVTFDDLERFTWQLLTKQETAIHVVPRLHKRYRYFMIDEFQDTNQRQWEMIRPLVSDKNGKIFRDRLFIVGDPKQSIYGFRNADVTVFNYVRKIIVESNIVNGIQKNPAERAPGDIHMDCNFRSRPAILAFTDAVCTPVMTEGESYEVVYEPLEPARNLQDDYDEDKGAVALLAPSDIDPDCDVSYTNGIQSNNWLDIMIGHLVNLVEKDRFSWKDICIMYPARTRLSDLKAVLRKADVPYSIYKGIGFWQLPEIRDITGVIKWLADPQNKLALFTILRSPIFGLSDSALLLLSEQRIDFPNKPLPVEFFDYLSWSDNQALSRAREILLAARDSSGMLPLAQIIENLLVSTGAWGSYDVEDDSGQTEANIEKFLDIIMGFDREGVAPLWETAELLNQKEANDTREGEAVMLGGDNRVTLLTVHAAKGLEFSVVYLVGLEKDIKSTRESVIWDSEHGLGLRLSDINPELQNYKTHLFKKISQIKKKRENAENKRLLYVAFTRARDRLFLVHQPQRGKILQQSLRKQRWLDWILDGMEAINIDLIREADLINREAQEFPEMQSIMHLFDKESELELSNDVEISAFDETVYAAAVTTIRDYLFDRDDYIKKHVLHMVDHFRSPESNPGRDIAQKLGNVYHKLMEQHPDLNDSALEIACKKLLLELVSVDVSEQEKAVERLKLMVDHSRQWSIYESLKQGKGFHEISFNIYLDTGIVHGIIDLLICLDGIWYVVDYKTDRKFPGSNMDEWLEHHREEHVFQMSVYALSVMRMVPEQKIIPVLIFFADPGKVISYEFERIELDNCEKMLSKTLSEMKNASISFPLSEPGQH